MSRLEFKTTMIDKPRAFICKVERAQEEQSKQRDIYPKKEPKK
jgi:hypothetical protein